MEIGKRIKILREQKGLSQQDLADLSGFKNRQSIDQIEKSKTPPSITTLTKLAKGLGMQLIIEFAEQNKAETKPHFVEINSIKYKDSFITFPVQKVDLNHAAIGMPDGELKNNLPKYCKLLSEKKIQKAIQEESFEQALCLYFTEFYG